MNARNRTPTEADEQKTLFRWAEMEARRHPELNLLHHIPNGGSRDPREARNLKQEGVKAGVPDICLPVPRGGYNGLYIEMKRIRGGRLSDEQRGWLAALTANGYRAEVCRGWEAAKDLILEYLKP